MTADLWIPGAFRRALSTSPQSATTTADPAECSLRPPSPVRSGGRLLRTFGVSLATSELEVDEGGYSLGPHRMCREQPKGEDCRLCRNRETRETCHEELRAARRQV